MLDPIPVSSPAREIFDEILRESPRLPLTCGIAAPSRAVDRLHRLSDSELLGGEIVDPDLARSVRAGLLLRADRFEESHAISQQIETPEGSYWHGILHRREPDASNARYWLQRVRNHPILETLAIAPADSGMARPSALEAVVRNGRWDPERFVDLCASLPLLEGHGRQPADTSPTRRDLEDLQALEICALLRFCHAGALKGAATTRRDR